MREVKKKSIRSWDFVIKFIIIPKTIENHNAEYILETLKFWQWIEICPLKWGGGGWGGGGGGVRDLFNYKQRVDKTPSSAPFLSD
jgi:hypothetical protein